MAQAPEKQSPERLPSLMSFNGTLSQEENDLLRTKTGHLTFRASEDKLEKKKTEVKEKVVAQLGLIEKDKEKVVAQLGLIEKECKRLASIREEVDASGDPMKKEVTDVHEKIDAIKKERKHLAMACQKKERDYKESLETLSELDKEKVNLFKILLERLDENVQMKMAKLEYLNKSIETETLLPYKLTN